MNYDYIILLYISHGDEAYIAIISTLNLLLMMLILV